MTSNKSKIDLIEPESITVSSLGKALAKAEAKYEEYSERPPSDSVGKTYYKSSANHALDEIYTLIDLISHVEAKCLEDALIQMGTLLSVQSRLENHSDGDRQSESDSRQALRLWHSIKNAISKTAEITLTELDLARLEDNHRNPFISPSEQLKLLDDDTQKDVERFVSEAA